MKLPNRDRTMVQENLAQDPMLRKIIGTALLMSTVIGGLYLFWGEGPVIAVIPWFIPVANVFSVLTVFMTAYLAMVRYQVLREPTSYWVGIAYIGLGIGVIFFILAFPGLLPEGQAILARLPNTSSWVGFAAQTIFIVFLLAATLLRWPGQQALVGERWRWLMVAAMVVFVLIFIFSLVFEYSLPVLVDNTGKFTALNLAWNWTSNVFLAITAILALRHYLYSRDPVMGYVVINIMILFFATLTALIGAKRFDLWWILYRVLLITGYLFIMFGLLSEYLRLFRREHEGGLLLNAILENIPIGLAVTGGPPNFPLTKVSRHGLEMNQRPAESLVGSPSGKHQAAWKIYLSDGITEPSSEQMPLYRASRLGEEIHSMEMVMETQDGQKIPVLVNAAPIRDATGQIVAAVNTWLDITERKKAEEGLQAYAKQLERTNRDLQNLTIMASHDLQEPLRKIEAFGEAVLADSANLDEHQSDSIMRMRNSAHQMRKMVNGLLQLSLLSTSAQEFQEVDLNEVTAQILAELDEEIQQSGSVVEVGKLPVIEAHPVQIQRLLRHLLENALKFQPPGGKPRVKIYTMPSTQSLVQLLVEDNGIGFDEAKAKHLFEPFERLVRKNQSEYEGIGMGLTICRWITEHHGGEIAARSQPRQGATFIVTLPIRQQIISEEGAGRSLKHES